MLWNLAARLEAAPFQSDVAATFSAASGSRVLSRLALAILSRSWGQCLTLQDFTYDSDPALTPDPRIAVGRDRASLDWTAEAAVTT